MSNVKKYKVSDTFSNAEIRLEVDHSKLTPELAAEINKFWSGSKYRADQEEGDPVRAVIRLAGVTLIKEMLAAGGADFSECNDESRLYWSSYLSTQEGWPAQDSIGIRVIEASEIFVPDFETVELALLI